ncbi:ArsR/SmtB family transcription factor [Maritalea porphyrae]|uniref:ArsR/SmtB family transcription factor n=1 Tax=Maritalea porphyrae TaxID=880732 RepID=UPI0022AF3331|nr:metalloregulator ArsR/SmtB family transcription factor [Maritalea porphyrae]MCZ4272949.1 metalloregulator ArsR/SmtB family transcription factor [Maritalea porphyrae]
MDEEFVFIANALAHEKRLKVLEWLKDPESNFPPQVDGDLVSDGVCSGFIADKLGVSAPTASAHLGLLRDAGLISSKRIKKWTFYKRNEEAIQRVANRVASEL